MGAQLGVPYGHMGCRQFGVQFGYLDVYDLPFCVPYDVFARILAILAKIVVN